MNIWKLSFWVCFALLILSNVVLIYTIIDQAVTISYMGQGYEDQTKAKKLLGNLVVKGGRKYSQNDFLHLLRQAYPEALIVEDGDVITIEENMFTFSNGVLIDAK
ncbi:MAG: hypothetical protein P8179_12155 [Candidatus Thiodiazotropha sp.]|jgi:hypothetical protein